MKGDGGVEDWQKQRYGAEKGEGGVSFVPVIFMVFRRTAW